MLRKLLTRTECQSLHVETMDHRVREGPRLDSRLLSHPSNGMSSDEWGYIAAILFESELYRDLVRLSRVSKVAYRGCSKEMEKMKLVCTRLRSTGRLQPTSQAGREESLVPISHSNRRRRGRNPCFSVKYYTNNSPPILSSPIGYALPLSTTWIEPGTLPEGVVHPIRFDIPSFRRRGLLPAEIVIGDQEPERYAYIRWVSNGETFCVERHRLQSSQRNDIPPSPSQSEELESFHRMESGHWWVGSIPWMEPGPRDGPMGRALRRSEFPIIG
jgi:hypothetical protein